MTAVTKDASGQGTAPADVSAGIASRFSTAYAILFGRIVFMAALTPWPRREHCMICPIVRDAM